MQIELDDGAVLTERDFYDRHPCVAFAQPLTDAALADFGAHLLVVVPPIEARRAAAWERIKTERERRRVLGVRVGEHWYHSDDSSRIQQLGLVMMGASIPPELQWKTLTLSGPPVFVAMTQALAGGIFQATAASDAALFEAAELHRMAMELSDTPESYDCTTGWPASIEGAA